jgi:hypothetical protein
MMLFLKKNIELIRGLTLGLLSFFFYIIVNNILLHIEYTIFLRKIIYYPSIYGLFCPVKPLFSATKLVIFLADILLKFAIFFYIVRLLGKKNIVYDVFVVILILDFTYVIFSLFPIKVDFYFHSSRIFLLHNLFGYSNLIGFLAVGAIFILSILVIAKTNLKALSIYILYAISSFIFQFLIIHFILKVPIPS